MNQDVLDYIKKSRELGYNDGDIKTLLINAGHREEDVRAAFNTVGGTLYHHLLSIVINIQVRKTLQQTKRATSAKFR